MKCDINLKLELKDLESGKIVKTIEEKGNSIVRNFLEMILGAITDTNRNCKDLTGVIRTIRFSSDFNNGMVFGIVGNSDTSESIEDYTLSSYILGYATRIVSIETLTNGYRLKIGFDIEITISYIVKEVGIYQKLFDTGGTSRSILLIRNVLSTPIEITQPSILSVVYTIDFIV